MAFDKERRRDDSRAAHYRSRLPKKPGEHSFPVETTISLAKLIAMATQGLFTQPQKTGRRIDGTEGFIPRKKE